MDAQLEKLQRALAEAIAGMSEEELHWHPAGKWCAVEVLEHLCLTYTGTVKRLEGVMAKGKPLATAATWRQRWAAFVVNGLGYMPRGRKAPVFTQPRAASCATAVSEFGAKIAQMDGAIAGCEEQFGRRVKLAEHPFLGPLTASGWRRFHLVHGLHHAKRIRALRAGTQPEKRL
jgi:hypothetical protein